jgi:hypothetical protein
MRTLEWAAQGPTQSDEIVGGTGYPTKHRPAVWVPIEAVIG